MSAQLSAGQRALLQADLERRQQELDHRLKEHQGGMSRADHAREVLTGDSDDVSHREADRELDMLLSDRGIGDLGAISAALRRMRDGSYGVCVDCESDIAFARLKAEPWALRCVDCESRRERVRR